MRNFTTALRGLSGCRAISATSMLVVRANPATGTMCLKKLPNNHKYPPNSSTIRMMSLQANGVMLGLVFPRNLALARMHRAAARAGAQLLARVELLEERRQVAHDALQLHLDSVEQRVALAAIPLEAVPHAFRTRALDHQAHAPGLGPLRRVAHVRRHEEDRAFLQVDSSRLAVLHDV